MFDSEEVEKDIVTACEEGTCKAGLFSDYFLCLVRSCTAFCRLRERIRTYWQNKNVWSILTLHPLKRWKGIHQNHHWMVWHEMRGGRAFPTGQNKKERIVEDQSWRENSFYRPHAWKSGILVLPVAGVRCAAGSQTPGDHSAVCGAWRHLRAALGQERRPVCPSRSQVRVSTATRR